MSDRYVMFENLLATDRAVKRQGKWLRVSMAGGNPNRFWLEFDDTKTAKRAGGSLLVHLREKRAKGECNTDVMYNHIVYAWFNQLEEGGYLRNRRSEDGDGEVGNDD